jgi:flagellar operon protein
MTDIKGIGGIAGVPAGIKPTDKQKAGDGPSFLESLEKAFDQKADAKAAKEVPKPILQFSNHALERMSKRNIHFTPEQITKIEQAMQKASQKGAKEALLLTDESALIVSLKDSKVVTVMDREMLKENVFTNIDSTVFV